ncbi:MAG: hypothetical protein JST73_07030 [Actinobacteria bacterium]|nr:hypothetical protein [Actinomycetota bacterium]
MATTTKAATEAASNGISGIVDTVERSQKAALGSARKIVDSINGVIPELIDDGPRTKVIDAAFSLTGQILDASNDLTRKLVGAGTAA